MGLIPSTRRGGGVETQQRGPTPLEVMNLTSHCMCRTGATLYIDTDYFLLDHRKDKSVERLRSDKDLQTELLKNELPFISAGRNSGN